MLKYYNVLVLCTLISTVQPSRSKSPRLLVLERRRRSLIARHSGSYDGNYTLGSRHTPQSPACKALHVPFDLYQAILLCIYPPNRSGATFFPYRTIYSKISSPRRGKRRGEGALMVDVAGGLGHDLVSFNQRFPDAVTGTAAKLLQQDQKHVIEEVERKGGLGEEIRCEVYDFFNPHLYKVCNTAKHSTPVAAPFVHLHVSTQKA